MIGNIDISIIIPFYNEEKSLPILYHKIIDVLNRLKKTFEIIFIDDGSTDNSYKHVTALKQHNKDIKLIKLRSNSGKARALDEGFQLANGEIIFTMDADLQDDPEEIPRFLNKIEEGYDLVSGWKKRRFDPLEKRLVSKFFNYITSLVSGIKLHDFNCGFKAYKKDVLDEIKVYGDLHRYIPVLAYWRGFRVGEIPIQHHPRAFGKSKYGWKRYFQGFFDLFTINLLTRFINRPLYLFGIAGILLLLAGLVILLFITFLQVTYGSILGHKPLSYLGVLSILFGSQLVATGLIAQMLNVLKKDVKPYSVRQVIPGEQQDKIFDISIIIPTHNALEYWDLFIKELEDDVRIIMPRVEILFIDDRDDEGSLEKLLKLRATCNLDIKVISLRRCFGRSDAVRAGVDFAMGDKIVVMDGGMINIKGNLMKLLKPLEDNFDMAIGRRKGMPVIGSFFSKVFNGFASFLMGVKFHDLNCGLQSFKKELFQYIPGHYQQRCLNPIIAVKHGFKVAEVQIEYHDSHLMGKIDRLKHFFRFFLDILSGILMTDFRTRPLHLFGVIGLFIGAVGLLINLYLCILKFRTGDMGGHYTLLLMGVTLMVLGLQWFSTGLLGEIINNLHQKDINKKKIDIAIK